MEPGLHIKYQDNQGNTQRPCLKKDKNQKNDNRIPNKYMYGCIQTWIDGRVDPIHAQMHEWMHRRAHAHIPEWVDE